MLADGGGLVRSSRFITLRLLKGQYIAQNPLVGQQRFLPLSLIAFLASAQTPMSTASACAHLSDLFPGTSALASKAAVSQLIEAGILVELSSNLDHQENRFDECVWQSETMAHSLATRRVRWMAEESEVEAFGELLREQAIPALWNDLDDDGTSWQPFGVDLAARKVFQIFGLRRSLRQFGSKPLAREALGAVLSSGLGIQGFLQLPFRPTYPLRFTPSPGALNVFTGYLLAHNVLDIRSGIYAFNGFRNQGKRIGELPTAPLSTLFGNQQWANEAAAICILCADYQKMSWKYNDPSAFNSLLIESGHIAQNMMVCAAALSIGSVPTNAVDQAGLEQLLGLTFPHQAVLYAIAFGHEDPHRSRDHYSASTLARLREIMEVDDGAKSPVRTTPC